MGALPIIRGENAIVADVQARLRRRGASKLVSHETGIARSHLIGIANGNARVGPQTAARLGYQLAYERRTLAKVEAEDQALADKITEELHLPPVHRVEAT